MRICVTGLRGIPDLMGGIEAHCEELLPRIAKMAPNLKVQVLARRSYVQGNDRLYKNVEVTPLPSTRRQHTEAIISTLIGTLYARIKGARILHIHGIGPGLLAPLARLLGLRVVLTHHGADYERGKWGPFARFMLRLGERLSIGGAHQIIAIAPSLTESLKLRFPQAAGRIRYLPNGASTLPDGEQSAEEVLAGLGIAGGFILSVGRLVPEKGFGYLIEAVRKSGIGKQLVIVGAAQHNSPCAMDLIAQADDQIIFAGQQSRAVLKHLYTAADLFVLASFHEGLPISALEAAACGTPILLSDIAANRDIGLPAQHYFSVGNVGELAERLAQSTSCVSVDPDAVRAFDWDAIAGATLEVYVSLLGKVRATAPLAEAACK